MIRLVFIHGWGFDARFWDDLAARLPDYPHARVDMGFLGKTVFVPQEERQILVGHSLGFTHGILRRQGWAGWIAINGFPRFVEKPPQVGCVTAVALREMRMRFGADAVKTLHDFYGALGAKFPSGTPDTEKLRAGLDELRDADAGAALETLDVPGLVLASRNDPLVPVAASEALACSAANLLWHESGGHILPQSDYVWCAEATTGFLQTRFG